MNYLNKKKTKYLIGQESHLNISPSLSYEFLFVTIIVLLKEKTLENETKAKKKLFLIDLSSGGAPEH